VRCRVLRAAIDVGTSATIPCGWSAPCHFGLGTEHRAEHPAGALVHAPQKLPFRGITPIGRTRVAQRPCIAASGLVALRLCLPVAGAPTGEDVDGSAKNVGVDGLPMCLGSAAGRHERLAGDRSRPLAQKRPCALLALDDKVLDMRGRAINLALVVERLLQLGRHFYAGDVIGLVG
jgi:hypothetical protein